MPVRWNYIRWIQGLLDTTSDDYADRYDSQRDVLGLDIGTGASAIYPLLGCSTRPLWLMAGTDIDTHSLDYARQNVAGNNLEQRVKLIHTTAEGPLIPMAAMGVEELDFVMTNPPFYSSREDMEESYVGKDAAASAISFAADNELICPGGDIGFVDRVFNESLLLRTRVQWYTAMLGKLASLQQIVAKLREHEINNFAVTNLQAGHRTKRWAVAWSFQTWRPRDDIASAGDVVNAVRPWPTAQTIAVPLMSAKWAGEKVDATLKGLAVRWKWRPLISAGVMEATENVWSRAARRRQQFGKPWSKGGGQGGDVHASGHRDVDGKDEDDKQDKEDDDDEEDEEDEDDGTSLAVKVICKEEEVEIRWLRGLDRLLFESFCGMLKRALGSRDA